MSQPQAHTDNALLVLCQQEQGVVAGDVLPNLGVHSLTESRSHLCPQPKKASSQNNAETKTQTFDYGLFQVR